MEIVYKNTEDLQAYENNPRKNDKAVDAVVESIRNFGFKIPVVIDANDVIVCGHTRIKAAKKMGLEQVPCVIADDLDEEKIRAFRLVDNKTAELAEWDPELLMEELAAITDLDMTQFGFEDPEELNPDSVEDDDFDEGKALDEIKEPKTRKGDIYILGDHRLLCGDSTSSEDVNRLVNGQLVDLLLTDPPYNIDYEGKTKDKLKIENDKMANEDFIAFLCSVFSNAKTVMKEGASFYIWYASIAAAEFINGLRAADLELREVLVWVKNIFCLGRQDYQWRHELCLYGWKEGAAHYFINDRTQSTVFDYTIDYENAKLKDLRDHYRQLMEFSSVFYEEKPSINAMHPTMKPIPLMARSIKNSTRKGEIVLDLFGGSGSTLIACEKTKRKCLMMEFDPKYCDVIVKRWEDLTGEKADRINGEEEMDFED